MIVCVQSVRSSRRGSKQQEDDQDSENEVNIYY